MNKAFAEMVFKAEFLKQFDLALLALDGEVKSVISRAKLITRLGGAEGDEAIVNVLLSTGNYPHVKNFKGRFGGVGPTSLLTPPRPPNDDTKPKEKSQSDEDKAFMTLLTETLKRLVPENGYVSRHKIAMALNEPGSKMEAKISKALKSMPEYKTDKGSGKGIKRVVVVPVPIEESKQEVTGLTLEGTKDDDVENPAVNEIAPSPTLEAAVETNVETKKSKKTKTSKKKTTAIEAAG